MSGIFRVMEKDDENLPKVGGWMNRITARIGPPVPPKTSCDITPCATTGKVLPSTGGLSVQPSLQSYQYGSLPGIVTRAASAINLIPNAAGRPSNHLWQWQEKEWADGAVSAGLQLREDTGHLDPNGDVMHGFVEPDSPMLPNNYQQALVATRGEWRLLA